MPRSPLDARDGPVQAHSEAARQVAHEMRERAVLDEILLAGFPRPRLKDCLCEPKIAELRAKVVGITDVGELDCARVGAALPQPGLNRHVGAGRRQRGARQLLKHEVVNGGECRVAVAAGGDKPRGVTPEECVRPGAL